MSFLAAMAVMMIEVVLRLAVLVHQRQIAPGAGVLELEGPEDEADNCRADEEDA